MWRSVKMKNYCPKLRGTWIENEEGCTDVYYGTNVDVVVNKAFGTKKHGKLIIDDESLYESNIIAYIVYGYESICKLKIEYVKYKIDRFDYILQVIKNTVALDEDNKITDRQLRKRLRSLSRLSGYKYNTIIDLYENYEEY